MKSINKNFIYNIFYQVFVFIIPLVTTPYISRVLGVNNVGVYSYTYSIVYYFMLCGMLGINNYGARTIAKSSSDKEQFSHNFWSIYFMQLILTTVMLIMYLIMLLIVDYENKNIMLIQSIFLFSVAFDINWLFFGLEKFKITISRNIIIKILSLILIFFIVKVQTDLWKYTLIMSCSTLISQVYLWVYVKKYISFKKIKINEIFIHLKQCLVLFIPIIAYSIYRVMDKTMIGYFCGAIELGNYESAEKIINIPLSFITALGTVMLPYMSKVKDDEYNKRILSTFELCFCCIIPMAFGLFIISDDFSLLFFGNEFDKTAIIIKLLVPTIIFAAIANVIRTNYLIPKLQDNIYVKSTILGAIVNLIFNLIFIKIYGAYGACIGTILAEFTVMIYQILKTKDIINYFSILKLFIKYLLKSIIMSSVIIIIGLIIKNLYFKIIMQVISGILIYSLLTYKYIKYDFLEKKEKNEKK